MRADAGRKVQGIAAPLLASYKLTKGFDCADRRQEPLRPKRIQVILDGFGRIFQTETYSSHRLEKSRLGQVKLVHQELIRVLRFYSRGCPD